MKQWYSFRSKDGKVQGYCPARSKAEVARFAGYPIEELYIEQVEFKGSKVKEGVNMCKHEWIEKPDYNEKWCPKCNKIEMLVTRRELLSMPMEKRREILAKQSVAFVENHPSYFKDLL